jgi:serine/threonine protein kinase
VLKLGEKSVFHSDIKPDNFVIEKNFKEVSRFIIKMIDFGCSS